MSANTRAPSTIITIALTGQTDFNVPFEYLARKFVEVTLLGVNRLPLVLNTDYRFVSKTMISLTRPYTAEYSKLEIRRVTSASERLVDFHDGSILRAYDLNLSQIQTLHVAEEARDLTADTIGVNDEGHLDARNRKIVNLAYAENNADAIPLGQVIQWNTSALNSATRAENAAFAAEAANTEANASKNIAVENAGKTAADRVVTHADASITTTNVQLSEASAVRSEQAKVAATLSETAAAESAVKAKQEADRAKTEADKLGDWNALAGLVHVNPTDITFDKGLVVKTNEVSNGVTIETSSGQGIGVRLKSPNVQYEMVNSGHSMEESVKTASGAGSIVRTLFTEGKTQWNTVNEYLGATRYVGDVIYCWNGSTYRQSVSYIPNSDTRIERDYVASYKVIDEQGRLIGGREGTLTNVGAGIDLGLDPNQDYLVRIHLPVDAEARSPVLVTKPNINSAAKVQMRLNTIINRSFIGDHAGSSDVWSQHFDDGYIEQGGIITATTDAPVLVQLPLAVDKVWGITITTVTDGPRSTSAEANSTVTEFNNSGFYLHSGQAKSPCRFMWCVRGMRTTPQ